MMALPQADDRTRAGAPGRKTGAWLVGAMVVFLLLLYWAYLPRHAERAAFYTGDQGIRLMQLEGMKRHGFGLFHNPSPRIDPDVEFFHDPALRRAHGRSVWMIPPFFALITLPAYATFGAFGLYLLPALGAVLAVAALWRGGDAAGGTSYSGPIAAGLFGLASPAVFYGAEFSEHAVATGLAVAGICCCLAVRDRWWGAGCCGLLCAAAASMRTECVVMLAAAAVLICFAAPRGRITASIVALAVGAVVVLGPLAALNVAWFGHPWGLHASGNVWRSGLLGPASVLGPARIVLLPPHAYQMAAIAAAVVFKLLAMAVGASPTWRRGLNWAFAAALVCLAVAAVVLPLAHKALFVVAPWALCLLAPVGLRDGSSNGASEPERRAAPRGMLAGLSAASALYVIVVLLAAPGTGGALWGPRFLLPGLALLALAAGTAARLSVASARGAVRVAMLVAFVALALAGLWNGSRSLRSLCSIKHQNGMMLSGLIKHTGKGDVIVSDTWWLAQVSAVLVYRRHFFIIPDDPDAEARVGKLLGRLRALGVERIHYVTAIAGPSPLRSRIEAEATPAGWRLLVPYDQLMETYVLHGQ
ncbi:MAG: hypothetical protein PVH68_16600 [Armatimonadota bacterium]|jgi:hypothetical protein